MVAKNNIKNTTFSRLCIHVQLHLKSFTEFKIQNVVSPGIDLDRTYQSGAWGLRSSTALHISSTRASRLMDWLRSLNLSNSNTGELPAAELAQCVTDVCLQRDVGPNCVTNSGKNETCWWLGRIFSVPLTDILRFPFAIYYFFQSLDVKWPSAPFN